MQVGLHITHASGQAVVVSHEYQWVTPAGSVDLAAAQPQLAGTAPHEVISGQANQTNQANQTFG